MTALPGLFTALGWSLLDSVWQMAVLWTGFCLLTSGNKRFSAAARHNLGIFFITAGTAWFFISFGISFTNPAAASINGFIPVSPSTNHWMPLLSVVYLTVLCFRILQLFFQINAGSGSMLPAGKAILEFTGCQSVLLGIRRKVGVFVSASAETAETSGFLKPMILLPFSLVTRLSPAELEAILVHELFHIRRNDWLINIGLTAFKTLFFFNPFARFFYRMICRERELACDDGVLSAGYQPGLYAEALFRLEKIRRPGAGLTLAVDGNKPWLLMERISRILGKTTPGRKKFNYFYLFSLTAAVLMLSLQPVKNIPENKQPPLQMAVIPARYDIRSETNPLRDLVKLVPPPKPKKSQKKAPVVYTIRKEIIPVRIAEQTGPRTYSFVYNRVAREFSNQSANGMSQELIRQIPGTPYTPSASLSYEAIPEIMAADSLHEAAVDKAMQNVLLLYRVEQLNQLKVLEKELISAQQEIRKLEWQNKKLIIPERRKPDMLLENFRKSLKLKKEKLDRLRIRLQVTGDEIIHI